MPPRNGPNPGDQERVKKSMTSFPVAIARELKGALKQHGRWWQSRMDLRFRAPLTRYGDANPYDTLHNRSNFLRHSMRSKVIGTRLADLTLTMGSSSPYARLQELGGVVRPRGGKYLAIPVDDNLTPAGVPRRRSPREVPNGRFVELPSGSLWFVEDTENDVKFLFALRKEVDIPGPGPRARRKRRSRLGMRDTALGPDSKRQMHRRIIIASKRALIKATGGTGRGGRSTSG